MAEQKIQQQKRAGFGSYCSECDERLQLSQAEIFTLQGRSKDVVALLSEERPLQPEPVQYSIQRNIYRSLAHAFLGQEHLSDEEAHRAELLAATSHSPFEGKLLQAKGIIAARHSQFPASAQSFNDSLAFARNHGDKRLEAEDLLDLGWLSLIVEHYDDALDSFQASSKAAQSIGARDLLENALGNSGWAHYALGDYDVALPDFVEATEQARKLGTILTEINWQTNAGTCRYKLGDVKGAEADYLAALNKVEATGNKKMISGIHESLALLYLQTGQLGAAQQHAAAAMEAGSASGDKTTELDARFLQARVVERQGGRPEAMRLFEAIYREPLKSNSLKCSIENAAANLSADAGQPQQAETWFHRSVATFETERSAIKDEELRLPFFANGDEIYRDYAGFLIRSRSSDQALRLLDQARARTLMDGLGESAGAAGRAENTNIDPRLVARRMNATVLFYSLGAEKSYLWAADAHRTRLFLLPKKAEIEASVDAYQKTILKSGDPLRTADDNARALYGMLVAPAASMIPAGGRVVLIPDGSLNRLNFETLLVPDAKGLHYWIENVTITTTNSIRLLSGTHAGTSGKATLLLMGNPVARRNDFEALLNAPEEIERIKQQFPLQDRTVITQANAIPAAYASSHPARFSYIHFVAHGTASSISPLDSAVILSPSPGHPESYRLYARDIVRNPIHAELVTISACYGSGVRAYAGEGLVGLSWAFLRAGSHRVIGALWEADDASTPQLMDEMYRNLRSGESADTALRRAKLSLLHSDSVYRKPLYWAAFQLYAGS